MDMFENMGKMKKTTFVEAKKKPKYKD